MSAPSRLVGTSSERTAGFLAAIDGAGSQRRRGSEDHHDGGQYGLPARRDDVIGDGEMDQEAGLTLKVRRDNAKYAWSLYRSGITAPIKFSVPIFSTEAAATAAGMEVLTRVTMRDK
jgi:hypothetical protein